MFNKNKKPVVIDFSNYSGGENNTDPAVSLNKNQCVSSKNAYLREDGFKKYPGFIGIDTGGAISANPSRGMFIYEQFDGTETQVLVHGDTVSAVDLADGDLTTLYTLSGASNEAWACNILGKMFLATGKGVVKIESATTAYRVGIAAPAAGSAAAAAGGTLTDGVYNVYIGYARKVSSSNVLFSQGYSLGNVTLGSGNNTVSITSFANSSDTQVNNKVVWMTDAGGTLIHYYYGETGNNTATSISISSASNRNSALKYEVEAMLNYVPPEFEYVYAFNNRIYGNVSNVLYCSLQAGTVYDLERFNTQANGNIATMPYPITGIFGVGEHLYLNTSYGLIRIPYGDISAQYEFIKDSIDRKINFAYPRTVAKIYGGSVIGVTSDGVRIFDGEAYSVDLSKHIKADIAKLTGGSTSGSYPAGIVFNYTDRSEYRISYRDTSVGTVLNNVTKCLNLNTLQVSNEERYLAQWSTITHGFNYATVNNANLIYCSQSKSNGNVIYKENTSSKNDRYIYNVAGTFLTASTIRETEIITREDYPDVLGSIRCLQLRVMAISRNSYDITVYVPNRSGLKETAPANNSTVATWGTSIWGQSTWTLTRPQMKILKLPAGRLKGRSVWLKFEQSADDSDFNLVSMSVVGLVERGHFL